jgi:hypothetical protein
MDRNVGASFGLSVLIVVFFAVALYPPDHPPPAPAARPPVEPVKPLDAHPPAPEDQPAPVAAPDVPARPVVPEAPRVEPDQNEPAARAPSPAPQRSTPPEEPRGAFTQVREGETLADVALRVYGAGDDAVRALWLANRDLLDRADAPLRAGSVLRTP